jgi:hypothetical protein
MLQRLREVPGFLSFAVVLMFLFMREQTLALWTLRVDIVYPLGAFHCASVKFHLIYSADGSGDQVQSKVNDQIWPSQPQQRYRWGGTIRFVRGILGN